MEISTLFFDRKQAGHFLAEKFEKYRDRPDVLVIGLARGGVVVAHEFSQKLSLPLNVVTPRKIGAPGNPELAIGSIMENGEGVFNQSLIRMLNVSENYIKQEVEKEKLRAQKRLKLYRQSTPLPNIKENMVILVDDGIATGSTMLTVIKSMRQANAKQIVVAAPVASTEAFHLITKAADEVVCPYVKDDFTAVGIYYQFFGQTEDEEVVELLKSKNAKLPSNENNKKRLN